MSAIALKGKLLIDGTGNPPIDHGVLLIEGERIVAAGTPNEISIPPDAEVIDCADHVLLPGLVHPHVHLSTFIPGFGAQEPRPGVYREFTDWMRAQTEAPVALRVLRAYMGLVNDMSAGVTTVRALGDADGIDVTIRDAVNTGEILGPRILASVRPLRPSHGTARFLASNADGAEGLRKAVRENIVMGADVIKIFATNITQGLGEVAYRFGDLTRVPAYTKEEMVAAVEEAHRAGIMVAAHAIGGPGMRWAMEAGVDTVEHANLMEEQDIDVFLETGAILCDPNLYLFFDKEYGFESRPEWHALPDWWKEKVRYAREQTQAFQGKAFHAGVKFALAIDSGHGYLWREAKAMIEALGASAIDAIMALTKNGAEACGLAHEVGTLEPGKLADVISVEGNPLDDITNLQHVKLVMKGGQRYDQISLFESCDGAL